MRYSFGTASTGDGFAAKSSFREPRSAHHRLIGRGVGYGAVCGRGIPHPGGLIDHRPMARLLLAVLASMLAATAVAQSLTGQTSIIDGDTLEIHEQRIRLSGIDAARIFPTLSRRRQPAISVRGQGGE